MERSGSLKTEVMSFSENTELQMKRLFASLSENDLRGYAGVEATKLRHGGFEYRSRLF